MKKKISEITKEDRKKLCNKYINKSGNCMNCPLYNIETQLHPMAGMPNNIQASDSACGVLQTKWELEHIVDKVNQDYDDIKNEEVEL